MTTKRIYTAESSLRRPSRLVKAMVRDIRESRYLAMTLATRDIRAMDRQSALGILWAFIIPLVNAATWIFLRGSGIIAMADSEIPYPIYVFTGTMLWGIISDSIQAPLQKTIAGKSLLSKVNFPREALVLSAIYHALFGSSIKVALMILGMVALGYDFLNAYFLFFPLGILSLVIIGASIGLLLTPIGLLYTDIGRAIPIIMQFLMYLTPVVFVLPDGGWIGELMNYNPFTSILITSREWITGNPPGNIVAFCSVTGIGILLFFGAWAAYRVSMPILIERMSS